MKKVITILLITLTALIIFWSFQKKSEAPAVQIPSSENEANLNQPSIPKIAFNIPLLNSQDRITKKPFGVLINPKTSPVQGERFSGYHTGTDFETFPEEASVDVEVRSICAGEIIQKKRVSGYGGIIVQSCILEGKRTIVLYGHLKLSGSSAEVGKTFSLEDKLASLGADGSADTDGERKHLHLGIKRGDIIDWRGYVSNEKELAGWLNPEKIIFPPVL
jgi:hypothetical protein